MRGFCRPVSCCHPVSRLALFVLAAGCCAGVVHCQTLPAQQSPVDQQRPAPLEEICGRRTDFLTEVPMPVEKFVEAVRETCPELNVVIVESVRNIEVGPVHFRQAPVGSVLQSLEPLSNFRLMVGPAHAGEFLVVGANPQFVPETRVLRVLGIEPLLGPDPEARSRNMEQVTSAIEAGSRMLGPDVPALQLQLHPATGLLFTRGTPDQVSMVTEIIGELVKNKRARPNSGSGGRAGAGSSAGEAEPGVGPGNGR